MNYFQTVLAFFALLGAFDKITGNHLKLGDEFEKGIMSTGSLALAMVGMMVLAPTISKVLIPIFKPVSEFFHIDPSFIAGFLANDMGGATVAKELSPTVWGGFNGLIVASMMGVTICFTIPMPLKTVDKRYHKDLLGGITCGIITMPIGCFVGGLMIGCPIVELIINLMPIILVSAVVCVGLLTKPELTQKIFEIIGNIVLIVITIGLAAGVFDYFTGIKLIPYMSSIGDAFSSVWGIAVTLTGVLPFIAVVSRLLNRPLKLLGKLLAINEQSLVGLVVSLSNSIPMITMLENMNTKGIMMNMAFAVSASFVFGDHLAFTMAFDNTYIAGMVVAKLVGGISALIVTHFYYNAAVRKKTPSAIGVIENV